MSARRLQLVWCIRQEPDAVLKVAFASTDRRRVNQHFGAAEGFVVFEVTPDKATLVGVGEFAEEAMDGNENKLAAKVDFLAGCHAVYVMAIGASAIKQLMSKGIQPIRVNEVDAIDDLLADVSDCSYQDQFDMKTPQVAIETQTAQNPAVFRPIGADGYVHIVMPMTMR